MLDNRRGVAALFTLLARGPNQATSSNDITFWVLHGTVDRLWHFKQLGNQNSYDKTWTHNNTCYCHNPQDYQPFKNIFEACQRRIIMNN